jgi:hypothetical protein
MIMGICRVAGVLTGLLVFITYTGLTTHFNHLNLFDINTLKIFLIHTAAVVGKLILQQGIGYPVKKHYRTLVSDR